jgi:hypothetical protein
MSANVETIDGTTPMATDDVSSRLAAKAMDITAQADAINSVSARDTRLVITFLRASMRQSRHETKHNPAGHLEDSDGDD